MLVRHGETEWSRTGRHTGVTDVSLTENGEEQAARLRQRLAERSFVLVATSPRQRARRTAELAGLLVVGRTATARTATAREATAREATAREATAREATARVETWDDLAEWDYGDYEGVTTPEIRRTVPGWTVFSSPVPGGETAEQVARRADRVIRRAGPYLANGDVAFVGHGHMLRVVVARWLGLDATAGALFVLDAGGLSELGHEHGTRVVLRLNEPA